MIYAGFWRRFSALFLDSLILYPLVWLLGWGRGNFRLFDLYSFIPCVLFGLFYNVYLVQRYGGTPGKRWVEIRVVKVGGDPLSYREAFLRYIPEWIMSIASSLALVTATLQLTDAQYLGAKSLAERTLLVRSLTPDWYQPVQWVLGIWVLSELVVMLTNEKRRAIHDFIAGTVVIEDAQSCAPEESRVGDPLPRP